MKRLVTGLCTLLLLAVLTACSSGLTDKAAITRFFNRNEAKLVQAVESGDFSQVERLRGIEKIYVADDRVEFMCGGAGFGPSTSCFGFFYSAEDDLTAWNSGACPEDELVADGNGFSWEEDGGDNRYYVEEIGDHFFYYEAHF